MSTNIEIEAKILVSKDDFQKIIHHLSLQTTQPVRQTNHYIDDGKGQLRQYGFALRIREINNSFTLTLKSPMAEGTLEKNQTINQEEYLALKNKQMFPEGKVKSFLTMFGFDVNDLRIIAELTTDRIDTSYHGQHVCLDINAYHGQLDYEIESEQSSLKYAAETLKKLCDDVGINYQENHISKFSRALKASQ